MFTLPVAIPRTMIVDDCVAIFPPIPRITGMNAANATIFASIFSNAPIIEAAPIPPIQLAKSHGNLAFAFSQLDFKRISLSLPAPAIRKKSSVASSLITSTTSSTVTMPNNFESESRTGTAKKLYCATILATSSWSVSGLIE